MRKLKALLVYGFSLAAMTYAAWQLDFSILPRASADWGAGCCSATRECNGLGVICRSRTDTPFPCEIRYVSCGHELADM